MPRAACEHRLAMEGMRGENHKRIAGRRDLSHMVAETARSIPQSVTKRL